MITVRAFFAATYLLLFTIIIGCGLGGPRPEIVGQTATDGAPGFDYTVYVDCTVRNNGAKGNITISAELRNGSFWKKRDTVYLEKNMERKVTFTFAEAEFLEMGLSGYRFGCQTE